MSPVTWCPDMSSVVQAAVWSTSSPCCVTRARRDQIQPEQISQVLSENNRGYLYLLSLQQRRKLAIFHRRSFASSEAAAVSSFNRKPRGSLKTPNRLRPPPHTLGTSMSEWISLNTLWGKKNTFFHSLELAALFRFHGKTTQSCHGNLTDNKPPRGARALT